MSKTKIPRRKSAKGGYEVGYGKPPKATRFKPGQSGNPKGRPKGVRNFRTDVEAVLKAPVRVTRDGKPSQVSTQRAMLLRLLEKALGGDIRAIGHLIGLAQAFNNEELAAAAGLPADDAMVLEIYRTRVLSGAAGVSEGSNGALANAAPSGPVESAAPSERKVKRKRVQLKRYRRSNDGLQAPSPEDGGE